jgi:hypothetical protein
MKTLITLVAFAVVPLALNAADVTGTWKSEFDTQIGVQKYVFVLQQTGTVITGKANAEIGGEKYTTDLKEGKIDGDALSFVENLNFQGNELRITYDGKVAGDELKLNRHVGEFPAEQLVAKREPKSDGAGTAEPSLPVRAAFTAEHATQTWSLAELWADLPAYWTPFDFLVLEFRASSSQRFDLGIETTGGRLSKRIGPFAGVWVRAAIPLRFYREPPGSAIDLAATFNQPRSSYWINISGKVGPTKEVRGLTVAIDRPVGTPTFELRAVSLSKTDPGDAVLEGKPLVDEFGQYTHANWPGKAHSLDDLKHAWSAEAAALKDTKTERCEYGGFLNTSAKATGFFRVEQIDGRWWFVDPDGHLFFSTGVNGVGTGAATRIAGREDTFAALPPTNPAVGAPLAGARASSSDAPTTSAPALRRGGGRGGAFGGSFYTWNLQRRFGDDPGLRSAGEGGWRPAWAEFTTQRLAAWGFNTVQNWGAPRVPNGEPRVPYALMMRGWQMSGSVMGLPDVYADDFEQRVDEIAASQLDPARDDPWMLGFFIGNEPPWPGRESLLCDTILRGAANPMQKKLQAHLAAGDTPERRRDFVLTAFARYLDVINAAVRRHDPHHLNLGIRFGGSPHDEIVKLARGFDVYSQNIYRYAPDRAMLDHLYALVQRPMLIGEFHIGVPNRGLAQGLVLAMNQEERAVAYRYYVEQAASHPAMIGTHWFQWLDQPVTGRNDGENYNIGFVDVTDQPYAEMVAGAKLTHARLLGVHRGELPPVTRRPRASEADREAQTQ